VAVGVVLVPFALAAWEQRDPSIVGIVWSALIALFIWQGAGAALQAEEFRHRLPSLQAGSLARRSVTVAATTPLAEALRQASATQAGGIVVVDSGGRPLGVVQEAAVRAVPEARRPWLPVGDLARRIDPSEWIAADLAGEPLLAALNAAPAGEYLVAGADGTVYGVLATADVEAALGLSQRR
jgi:CBS domain-containing protein